MSTKNTHVSKPQKKEMCISTKKKEKKTRGVK